MRLRLAFLALVTGLFACSDQNPGPMMVPEPLFNAFDGCEACRGGLIKVVLQNQGPAAEVRVVSGGATLFEGSVLTGQEIDLAGPGQHGAFVDDVVLFVDGAEVGRFATDCAEAVGPGSVFGPLAVTFAVSRDGGIVCPVTPPPPPEPCDECKGGLVELTLRNNGPEALIRVESDGVVFEGVVPTGGEFTVLGDDKKGKLKKNTVVFVNGVEAEEIHTSCSQPIGPGTVFGDFEVVRAVSEDNGPVCPVVPTDPDGCQECKGGVVELTLRNNGPEALIRVESEGIVFEGVVPNGGEFTVFGDDKKGKLEKNTVVFVNGVEAEEIHTSCSQPIGPGTVFGNFEVVSAVSEKNGPVCPVTADPADCECEGGLVELTLRNDGAEALIRVESDGIVFEGVVPTGGEFTVFGDDKKGKLKKNTVVFVNGVETEEIHTSCSQPIGPGTVFGNFVVVSAVSEKNGPVCPVATTTAAAWSFSGSGPWQALLAS